MRSGFRIARLFGIDVNVDWSWVFIFVLVTWNLSTLFGQFHSDWGTAMRWGLGVAAALVFFVSVLAHELAHSLVAKSRGIPVRSITLFLFGGVSNIRSEPESPQAEFLMAIVGPLTSIVLGIGLVVAASAVSGPFTGLGSSPGRVIGQMGPLGTLLAWLGSINVSLGIFNLIPGFPLDGGRVLRSILWAATDNLRRATRWASWVGHVIAWAMILAGIAMVFGIQIPLLGSGLISGLWLAFIGWFLNSATSQSYQRVVIRDILEGVPVERMMHAGPPTVPADITVGTLVHEHIMQEGDCGFPVMQGDRLVGLVTLEDVRKIPRDAWESTSVHEIMTPADDLVTVSPDEDASDMMNTLMERDVRQLPVIRDGQVVGCVRRQDIMKWLQLEAQGA